MKKGSADRASLLAVGWLLKTSSHALRNRSACAVWLIAAPVAASVTIAAIIAISAIVAHAAHHGAAHATAETDHRAVADHAEKRERGLDFGRLFEIDRLFQLGDAFGAPDFLVFERALIGVEKRRDLRVGEGFGAERGLERPRFLGQSLARLQLFLNEVRENFLGRVVGAQIRELALDEPLEALFGRHIAARTPPARRAIGRVFGFGRVVGVGLSERKSAQRRKGYQKCQGGERRDFHGLGRGLRVENGVQLTAGTAGTG